jgi:hypothetical protein
LAGSAGFAGDIAGDASISGGSTNGASASVGSFGATCNLRVGGNLVISGGTGAGAYAEVIGTPDIGSAAQPVSVGGTIQLTAGSGAQAYAQINAQAFDTIYLSFPNLSAGGYTVNGLPVVSDGSSGFFAGGAPAILGVNLFVAYGVVPPAPVTTPTDSPQFSPQVDSLFRVADWTLSQPTFGRDTAGAGGASDLEDLASLQACQ